MQVHAYNPSTSDLREGLQKFRVIQGYKLWMTKHYQSNKYSTRRPLFSIPDLSYAKEKGPGSQPLYWWKAEPFQVSGDLCSVSMPRGLVELLKCMGSTFCLHKAHGEANHQFPACVPWNPFKGPINICVSLNFFLSPPSPNLRVFGIVMKTIAQVSFALHFKIEGVLSRRTSCAFPSTVLGLAIPLPLPPECGIRI